MKKLYILALIITGVIQNNDAFSQTWWQQNSQTSSDLNEIFYVNAQTGWSFGDSLDILGGFATGIVLKSVTQGVPWSQQNMGSPVYQVEGSYFLSTSKGVVVGRNKLSGNGAILTTNDGGNTWTALPPQIERLVDVQFINSNIGWAVGRNDYAIRTTDGGATWTNISANTGNHLNGVSFTNVNNGFVAGRSGNIIHSVDSGSTWFAQNSGTGNDLNAIDFVNDTTGWAVGKSGTILFTSDSGATWTTQNSSTTQDLFDVDFVNTTTGWTVGKSGTILKTTDAGVTWNQDTLTVATTQDITSIKMVNSTLGWFCGKGGIIYTYGISAPNSVKEVFPSLKVSVYPNPAKDIVNVQLQKNETVNVTMLNITGKIIFNKTVNNSSKFKINRNHLKSGIYLLKITTQNGLINHQKIIFR